MTTRAQQFECLAAGIMDAGSPIATGYVRFYAAGTTTLKNAYADKDKGSSFTKLALDADSRGVAYGDGVYKLKFYAGDPDDGGTDTGITIDNYKCTASRGNIRTVTAATDDLTRDDEFVNADTSSNSITLTLPDVDTVDDPITVKKISASNTLTVDTTDSQLIDGASSVAITVNNETVKFWPDQSADYWRKGNAAGQSIAGDTTSGRVLRSLFLKIEDGTDASTVKCTTLDGWNGDVIAAADNIPGDSTETSGFKLNDTPAAAPDVQIVASSLSGNAVAILSATITTNETGSDLICSPTVTSNNLKITFRNPPSGGNIDITTLVDTGDIYVLITYLTDA
jgi:hypothetical protein